MKLVVYNSRTRGFDDRIFVVRTGNIGLVFISPLGVHMKYMFRLHFPASINVVE
jgi:hypothetical protein